MYYCLDLTYRGEHPFFSFWDHVILFNIRHSKSIHFPTNFMITFFSLELNSILSYICTCSYPSTYCWTTMFHFCAIVNKVVVVMELQISLWQGVKFSGYLPRNEIVGLYGSSVLILWILQTGFYNGILTCSPTKVNNPHPLQQLLEMLKIVIL